MLMQASALRTHTESKLRGNTPSERYSQAVASARANTSGKQSASKVLNEGMLLEALGPKASNLLHLPLPSTLPLLDRPSAGNENGR